MQMINLVRQVAPVAVMRQAVDAAQMAAPVHPPFAGRVRRATDGDGAAMAALLFGAATALQFTFQASGSAVPYQLFLALPYLLALAVLAVAVGRRKGPAGLGR